MIFSIDRNGHLLSVSDAWLAKLGYAREEVVGRPLQDLLEPASPDQPDDSFSRQLFEAGRCDPGTYRLRGKSGFVVDVLLSGAAEIDEMDHTIRWTAVMEDVTANHAIGRTRNALLDTLLTKYKVSVTDSAGRIIEVNDEFCAMTGYRRQELLGETHRLIKSGHHDGAFFAEMWNRISAGQSWRGEICNRNRSGELYWVDCVIAPVAKADGQIERYVSIRSDITARKHAEQALRANEQLLDQIGHVAGIGGWELDVATSQLRWTGETPRIHGVEAGHKPSLEEAMAFYAPEARPVIGAAVARGMSEGKGWDLELPFIPKSGPPIWVRAVGQAEAVDGKVTRLLGTFQNITDQVARRQEVEALNERMSLATDSAGIGIWDYDIQENILVWDPWMYRLYGVVDRGVTESYDLWVRHVHPEDRDAAQLAIDTAIAGLTSLDSEYHILRGDGEIRRLRATARVVRDQAGKPQRLIGVAWDVTQLRGLAAQLAEQHELLRVTLQSIGDAVITTDPAGRITWLNPVAERMTGWKVAEAVGRLLPQVFHILNAETRLLAENPVTGCMQQGRIMGVASDTILVSRQGNEANIEDSAAPIRDDQGKLLGAVLVFHDVTEQRRLSGEMSYRASHDSLTGLINRTEFDLRLGRVLEDSHKDQSVHVLMYIDLDQFKLVNDVCGHTAGDQLLEKFAKILQERVRASDTVARLGGDEFAVILEHCTIEKAQRVGHEICERMDAFRFIHDGRSFRIGASVGLAPLDSRWATATAAMQAADIACFAAKEAGRNRVHVWIDSDIAMHLRHSEPRWAARIEQAIDEDRFCLYAQRIFEIGGQLDGPVHAEVLLRMMEPNGSIIAPGIFMPPAERFHLALRIDRWVLDKTLAWLSALPDLTVIDMLSVNLSGQSVGDRAFHRHVMELLGGVSRAIVRKLCFEITETAAITHIADAALFIEQVRATGVRIALDDFGAGASSFGYLKTLPVDFLKIDGQFITTLASNALDDAAVRCFANVAKVIGVRTVAEFVDKPDVLARLRDIGIDFGQGFLLHKPEPIAALLEARPPKADNVYLHPLLLRGARAE